MLSREKLKWVTTAATAFATTTSTAATAFATTTSTAATATTTSTAYTSTAATSTTATTSTASTTFAFLPRCSSMMHLLFWSTPFSSTHLNSSQKLPKEDRPCK